MSGVTVRLADYGLRVTVQMRSWDGTTAHDGYEAVTHLLGKAPADIAALVEEVERLRDEVAAERAAVVVWLREVADAPETYIDEGIALRDASAAIESGEHRREEEK